MPFVNTSRTRLWIADHRRSQTRSATLIIHGAGSSRLSFPKQLRQSQRINPVLVDLSGHGKSPGKGHDSINEHACDIAALLDAMALDSALIVGHSMGGAIAQMLALEYADRLAGLVLVSTGARLPVNPSLIDGVLEDRHAVISNLNRWMWSKNAPEALRKQSADIMLNTDPLVIRNDFLACDSFDVSGRLAEVTLPTLIVAGTHDKMTPLALSEDLAQRITRAELTIVSEGSHMMILEKPDIVTRAVEAWFKKTQ